MQIEEREQVAQETVRAVLRELLTARALRVEAQLCLDLQSSNSVQS